MLKRKIMKFAIPIIAGGILTCTLSPIKANAEWIQSEQRWWYSEGDSWAVGWREIDNKWYYFDEDGYMKTGWLFDGSNWYYLKSSGDMITGQLTLSGKEYHFDSSGRWLENSYSSSKGDYEISEETYTKGNTKIVYPKINNLNDSKKSDSINKSLKDEALAVTNYYDLSNSNTTLNVSYDVEYQDNNILSISYKGSFYGGDSAYPESVLYSTNIDMKQGNSIRLKDYADVNDIFNKLRNANDVLNLAESNELAEAQKEYLSNMNDSTLKDMIANADFYDNNGNVEFPKAFTYRRSDNIIIAMPVPHAIGDYAEFSIKK
ncbi:DUF4163 domain-containing protein [Clostridium saccharobutylicum]|uniref:Autolysin n=1 Tax=Clostridium saccharobutylicum TaxID=169679 RepID=A0A1S8NHS0_CLOSA|nr:DUF4163 domain-containing protein [Clostridium saccharobutylicum]OOM16034.1 autolysin [Clostridium saccharobutylicum]